MANVLEQAINCDDADQAAKTHWASSLMKLPTTCFRKPGQPIVSAVPLSSANG